MGSWTFVTPNSRLCFTSHRKARVKPAVSLTPSRGCTDLNALQKRVYRWKRILQNSSVFETICEALRSCLSARLASTRYLLNCYGLGWGDNETFLIQLAFASLLQSAFHIHQNHTWVSDPLMDALDAELVAALGLQPDKTWAAPSGDSREINQLPTLPAAIASAETTLALTMHSPGRHTVQSPSDEAGPGRVSCIDVTVGESQEEALFCRQHNSLNTDASDAVVILFMPHCDKFLYGAALKKLESLRQKDFLFGVSDQEVVQRAVIVLGNDLSQYDTFHDATIYRYNTFHDKKAVNDANTVLSRYRPNFRIHCFFPLFPAFPEAFNSLCVATFEPAPMDRHANEEQQQTALSAPNRLRAADPPLSPPE